MDNRQRRLIAAALLAASLLIVVYLVFFSPSESDISTPTPSNSNSQVWTQIPSTPETNDKRTAEALAAQSELTPESAKGNDEGSSANREMALLPDWMGRIQSVPTDATCPSAAVRDVRVSTGDELAAALESALPGDSITLAEGKYSGNFELAASGEQGKSIWICGPRTAILDAGGIDRGIGLQITGSNVGVWGITVTNAQKGIVIDGGDFVEIDNVEVHTTGDEAIHFRANATDGVVQDSDIHHTGLRSAKLGEGISVGSAVSDWPAISGGEADKSDRVHISRNRIWDTTAEAIDIKEGTSAGAIDFNSMDGTGMTEADSWVDLKGNSYVIRSNVGINSPGDGFQTHNIDNMGSGSGNEFVGNTAQVDGPGYGFYIHDPEETKNTVSCSNMVSKAESGFANVECVSQS